MAKIYKNDKDFLIIELDKEELIKLNFGPICDNCNTLIENKHFYVCCVNRCMCEDCLDDFIDNMKHYTDNASIEYEIIHFNYVMRALEQDERAMRTPNGKLTIYKEGQFDTD